MAGKRDFFIKRLHKAGNFIPVHWLMWFANQKLVLPFYHAVSDEKLPHIEHLYNVKNEKQFVADLDFLLRHFAPVDFLQFKEFAHSGKKRGKPFFLLSFDDGLKEFHDIIAPLLVKKGIPAICFLNSGFIDNKDLFYKYKASLLIGHLHKNKNLHLAGKLSNWSAKNSLNSISSWLLSVDYANKNKLDDCASQTGYSFQEYLISKKPYLTTGQVEHLISSGFHFGSHSIDHPEYRFLEFGEQIKQTKESTSYVTNRFSIDYKAFSFPFTDYGVSHKFFTTIADEKIVDISFGCAGIKREAYPYHFQRTAFERGNLNASQIYKAELIYSALQSLSGKNLIKRT